MDSMYKGHYLNVRKRLEPMESDSRTFANTMSLQVLSTSPNICNSTLTTYLLSQPINLSLVIVNSVHFLSIQTKPPFLQTYPQTQMSKLDNHNLILHHYQRPELVLRTRCPASNSFSPQNINEMDLYTFSNLK